MFRDSAIKTWLSRAFDVTSRILPEMYVFAVFNFALTIEEKLLSTSSDPVNVAVLATQ